MDNKKPFQNDPDLSRTVRRLSLEGNCSQLAGWIPDRPVTVVRAKYITKPIDNTQLVYVSQGVR